MTGKDFKEFAQRLPDDGEVEVNILEMSKAAGFHTYSDRVEWVAFDPQYLRSIQIPIERRARLVGDRIARTDD